MSRLLRRVVSTRIGAARAVLALVLALGTFGVTAAINAPSASASLCRDTTPVDIQAHTGPPSCLPLDTNPWGCSYDGRQKSATWVGGNIRNYVRLEYSPYCRAVWTRSTGPVWWGTIFTRTTWDGNKAHFYEDTLSLPIQGTHYTRELRDIGRYGFGCVFDGRVWVCTGLY